MIWGPIPPLSHEEMKVLKVLLIGLFILGFWALMMEVTNNKK